MTMTTARILAFAGSARRESWNRKVLEVAASGARAALAEVTFCASGALTNERAKSRLTALGARLAHTTVSLG